MKFLHFMLGIIFIQIIQNNQDVKINFPIGTKGTHYFDLTVEIKPAEKGYAKKIFVAKIDITKEVFYIKKNSFKDFHFYTTSLSKRVFKKINDFIVYGEEGNFNLSIDSDKFMLKDVPILILDEDSSFFSYESTLGLGVDSVFLLYLQKNFRITQFYMDYIEKQIVFGNNLTKELSKSSVGSIKCPVNDFIQDSPDKKHWKCQLNNVIINKKKQYYINSSGRKDKVVYDNQNLIYKNKYHTLFNIQEHYIFCPKDFINFLRENYFSDKKWGCSYEEFYGNNHFFCSKWAIIEGSPISFIFNNADVEFEAKDLFYDIEGHYFFLIVENKKGNFWEIGSIYNRVFDIVFDNKNKEIYFFNKNKELFYTEIRTFQNFEKRDLILIMISILTILQIGFIVLLISIKIFYL